MNNCSISGTLGGDPELFSPQSGDYSCLKFSVANSDERTKGANGEWDQYTSWFDIEFWTKNPTHWIKKLYKGTSVCVPVQAKQQRWEKDGQKRSKVIFKVKSGEFPLILEGKKEESGPSHTSQVSNPFKQNTQQSQDMFDNPFHTTNQNNGEPVF